MPSSTSTTRGPELSHGTSTAAPGTSAHSRAGNLDASGASNPLKNRSQYSLFSRRQIAAYYPSNNNVLTRQWRDTDGSLSSWKDFKSDTQSCQASFKKTVVATGRITECQTEQIVHAYFREDNHTIHLQMDGSTGSSTRDLPAAPLSASHHFPELALAVGDLDGVVDDQGNPHDEIALLYPVDGRMRLLVLNAQLADVAAFDVGPVVSGSASGDVALTLGDFDGNGIREIGLLHNGQFSVLCLDRHDSSHPALRQVDSVKLYTLKSTAAGSSARMVSGDFKGDGKEEVAISYGLSRSSQSATGDNSCYDLYLQLASIDTNLKITLGTRQAFGSKLIMGMAPVIDLAAGIFRYDPANGFDLNRRQLAVYSYYTSDKLGTVLSVDLFEIDRDMQPRKAGAFGHTVQSKWGGRCETGTLAVGNFLGMKTASPMMDLAISYRTYGERLSDPLQARLMILHCGDTYQLTQAAEISMGTMTLDSSHSGPWVSVPIVAADLKGDSYYLGAPTRIFLPQMITTRYIMYEPPKHIDYLPDDPANLAGPWSVVNVSRKDDLWVCFGQGAERTQEVTTKDSTSFDFGYSQSYDAKEAMKFGPDLLKLGVESDQKLKFEQNYKSATEKIDSAYRKASLSYQDTTNIDDEIGYEIKALDIWRYPCYGLKSGEKCGYYEMVIPTASPFQHSAGLNCADWYQPRHENGNVLSYPHCKLGTLFQPEDLGTFSIGGGATALRDVMARDSRTIDGNQGTVSLNWTEQSGSETSKHYETTLTHSADISIGATAEVEKGWLSGEGSATASFSSKEETSTGASSVTKITNETSKGVTLSYPSTMDNDKAYHADTAIYVTQDGTMKAAHAVDPTGSSLGSPWWKKHYWSRPDPALNLPTKYLWQNQQWVMNLETTRKRMRGIFIHRKNPNTGLDDLMGTALTDGDQVELTARIYNYSLHQDTGDFRVEFARVSYDPETGQQGTDRTVIGYAEGVHLTPMEMKQVSVHWDTSKLGGATTEEKKEYVIHVTVDPEGAVKNALHPRYLNGKEFVGGNKEGYWPWDSGIAVYGKAGKNQTTQACGANLSLDDRALALATARGLNGEDGEAIPCGTTQRLRVRFASDRSYPGFKFVKFLDNGELFATKLVSGVVQGSNFLWTDWTPGQEGEHRLSAEVVENRDAAQPGNRVDALRVLVTAAEASAQSSRR